MFFKHHQLPPSSWPKRALAKAESFLGFECGFHVDNQGWLIRALSLSNVLR